MLLTHYCKWFTVVAVVRNKLEDTQRKEQTQIYGTVEEQHEDGQEGCCLSRYITVIACRGGKLNQKTES